MLERLISGGFMMIPLMACSVIMVAVLIERGLAFHRNAKLDIRTLRAPRCWRCSAKGVSRMP